MAWCIVALAAVSHADTMQNDSSITRRVEQALSGDFRFREFKVGVSTRSSTVTLTGEVPTYLNKLDIERAVKRVEGVRVVVNMIAVRPTDRRDSDIAADINSRLMQHSFVRPADLVVQVNRGNAVLHGIVNTWAQSRQAERTAREVAGVVHVLNELRVANEPMRADGHIQQDVEAAFGRDVYLSNFPIQVTVHNGQVLLKGSVQDLFLWDKATAEAMLVPGVVDVDNQLEVVAPESIEELFELQESGDERTRERVYRELAGDPRVDSDAITVSVRSRVVTLSGEVPTMFQRQIAQITARSVLGVARVENELTVNAEPREDDDIRQDVLSALASDSSLGMAKIGVQVDQATITLTGEVQDSNSKLHAERVVGRMRGVRGINNELRVAWSRSFSDDALAKRICERLASNAQTRWAAKRIRVAVKNGVAVLSGRVSRWSERREAERVARLTDGVRSVDNQLAVGTLF